MDEGEDNGIAWPLLRMAVRGLCGMALRMGMRLPQLLIEVTNTFESLHEGAQEEKAPEEPEEEQAVQIIGPYYGFDVPAPTADKLARASLIESCSGTHYHPNLPDQAHPAEHERMRLRIIHFLEGLRN